jgi:hypothetical protein
MSRYERRTYFERLCSLRDGYATLGDEDRIPVMTIEAAIDWAEAEIGRAPIFELTPADEAKA